MKFYQLLPIGGNSEAVESLPPYLARMANAHQRSVKDLLQRMVDNQPCRLSGEITRELPHQIVARGRASMVLPTRQTQLLVSLIEQSCGVAGLRGITFLAFESVQFDPAYRFSHIRYAGVRRVLPMTGITSRSHTFDCCGALPRSIAVMNTMCR